MHCEISKACVCFYLKWYKGDRNRTECVNINTIEKAQHIFCFKGLKGCFWKNWLSGFMSQQKLSLEYATKLPYQNSKK